MNFHHRFIVTPIEMLQILAFVALATPTPAITDVAGVGWHNSFEDARQVSRATGKPILHLQMFGKLNDEFC